MTTTLPKLSTPTAPVALPRRRPNAFLGALIWLTGWLWRWGVGAILCLNYVTSILVVGWSYRWMQGRVLRNWWKQSVRPDDETFDEFCDTLGRAGPTPRPRWLLQERIQRHLSEPGPNGQPASRWRRLGRWLIVPWQSLWANFILGCQALFCTYLLTGPGCLLMSLAWFFGWEISFHKVYEEAGLGALTSLTGIALFVLAMFYVPLAQVHHAVTGEARAFFDFRFIGRLVRARLSSLCWLAFLVLLVSLPFELVKTFAFHFVDVGGKTQLLLIGTRRDLTPAEMLAAMQQFLLVACVLFFPVLLLVRRVTCRIYSAAVLQVLRADPKLVSDLHPRLSAWLKPLGMLPPPAPVVVPPRWFLMRWGLGLVQGLWWLGNKITFGLLGWLTQWSWRRLLYTTLFALWLLFVVKTYFGEFLHYHPFWGYVNHVLIQFPALDYVPQHLKDAAGG